ncbi:MAG: TIGR02556 family CRISPR-associated protein [Firmicutes bacterium]|nr:TIGR02556 family CRISPR-associated protein [Bacillota bacterium]
MLEAIAGFGRSLSQEDDPLATLVKPVQKLKDKEVYLIQLDLRDGTEKLQLIPSPIEVDRDIRIRYRWIGNMVGNRPQTYLTTDNLNYLVGSNVFNLLEYLKNIGLENTVLYKDLSQLHHSFYTSLPNRNPILDVEKLSLLESGFINAAWHEKKEKPKAVLAEVSTALKKKLLTELNLKAPQAVLWTLAYNGRPLAVDRTYDQAIMQSKEPPYLETGTKENVDAATEQVCSICGATDRPVTDNFATLDFLKYYITDKIGFASGLQDFSRNFTACGKCYYGLQLAEKFLPQHMSLRVGPLQFMVVPAFLTGVAPESTDIRSWSELFLDRVNGLVDTTAWLDKIGGSDGLETRLADYLDDLPGEDIALLNFLFYQKNQSEFRIHALVRDVSPSWINHLLKEAYKLTNRAAGLLGRDRWHFDLTALYRLIPLRKGQNEEFKKLLHIYQSLLHRRAISYSSLIREFVALAKIFLTSNFDSTSIQRPNKGYEELEMARRLLQANLFLAFLNKEKLLKGGNLMNNDAEEKHGQVYLKEDMHLYLVEMGYNETHTALFLLGYLLHQIGSSQRNSGYKHKPILDKINYNGMSWSKVVRLSNLLVDQLHQHRIFIYNENNFAIMKKLFDANKSAWPLSPEENVFFILSGYAWATRAAYKAGMEKQAEAAESPGMNDSNEEEDN